MGSAERAVRRLKEGTSAVLLQSGLDEKLVGRFHGMLYLSAKHVTDLLSDGKTSIRETFLEKPFKGPIIPFGSLVEYDPISAKDQSRINQFGKKVLPGLFLGYASVRGENFGRVTSLVADIEELETMDASEIYSKRHNAKELIFLQRKWKIFFPAADGRIKFVGGDQELRTSTLIRDHPIRGESRRDFLRESEWSPPSTTSRLTSRCR